MNYSRDRIKIAFLTLHDLKGEMSCSIALNYMAKALQKHCGDVYFLGPVNFPYKFILSLASKLSRLVLKKRFNYSHSISLSKRYSKVFSRLLSEQHFDLIFAPFNSTGIAFLDTEKPIVYLSDATFSLIVDYYSYFSNLMNISILEGNTIERLAIERANLIVFSSQYAKQSAIKDYHADKSKIHVIPFGANLKKIPGKEEILKKKKTDCCKLLFLGTDWHRKGGEIAFDTLLELEKLGIMAELTICGCTPASRFLHERISVIPFLDNPTDLLKRSDFLLLPSRSELSPHVICEANAFGIPVITTNTGGIPEVVIHGKNGFVLPLSARGVDYAKIIHRIYNDDQLYYKLLRSSRAVFDETLNWDIWAISLKKIIYRLLLI